MKIHRFNDLLLVHALEAMRTPGGKRISEDAWQALKGNVITNDDDDGADLRLSSVRGGYECACEWRIVSYAMRVRAMLNAKAAG